MELTVDILANRAKWEHTGDVRPPWAETPSAGQRSVWDFPRPPRIEPIAGLVRVEFRTQVVARSAHALQVLETASPPTIYLPPGDVERSVLTASETATICEWKGRAAHFGISVGGTARADAAWTYEDPFPEFAALAGYVSFYPARVDACWIGEERVAPQPGDAYGGWVTVDLVGPFKGAPGSGDW